MNVDEDNLNICTERPSKKRKAKVSTIALSRQRRNVDEIWKDVYGLQRTRNENNDGRILAPKGCCINSRHSCKQAPSDCVTAIGGFARVCSIRHELWPEVRTKMVERSGLTLSVPTDSPQRTRGNKLEQYMLGNTNVDMNEDGDENVNITIKYVLYDNSNEEVIVCKNTWHDVTGFPKTGSAFRNAKKAIEARLMKRLSNDPEDLSAVPMINFSGGIHVSPSRTRGGQMGMRARNSMEWLAKQIENYSDPMPHEWKLVLFYSKWAVCHAACCDALAEYQNLPKEDVSICYSWFMSLKETSSIVQDAIAATVQRAIGECESDVTKEVMRKASRWVVVCKDPRKNETFGRCTVCCDIEAGKVRAAQKGERPVFNQFKSIYALHYEDFMSRRRKMDELIQTAQDEPSKVLVICMDAIDKRKMDSPMFPSSIRRTKKLMAATTRFSYTCVGAIAWGHSEHRSLVFHDDFMANHSGLAGSGANETLTILMMVLLELEEANKLPNSLEKRVLHGILDNCSTNKNKIVVAFFCLLVKWDVFTETAIHFLLVGHTHIVIDQWFRTLSDAIKQTADCIATTPKLQAWLSTKFKCSVHELGAYLDFWRVLDPHVGAILNLSKAKTFKFKRVRGEVQGFYQSSQDTSGEWYPLNMFKDTIETIADDAALILPTMPLRSYEQTIPGCDVDVDGAIQNDQVARMLGEARKVYVHANSVRQDDDALDISVLDWWDAHVSNLRNPDRLRERERNPGMPITKYCRRVNAAFQIKFKQANVDGPHPITTQREMTRELAVSIGALPADPGPVICSVGITRKDTTYLQNQKQYAYNLQRIKCLSDRGEIYSSHLPKKGQWLVYSWASDENDEPQWALGKATSNPVLDGSKGATLCVTLED